MGILERMKDILASNVNALLDAAEDPAKMADQLLENSLKDLADAKVQTAQLNANTEMMRKELEKCETQIAQATLAAQNALKSGKEDVARQVLTRRAELEAELPQHQRRYDDAKASSDSMTETYNKLVNDIETLKRRRDGIKADVASAKAQESLNKVQGRLNQSSTMDKFAQMEQKAAKRAMTAKEMAKLDNNENDTDSLIAQYASGPVSTDVDAALAEMKASLGL